VAEDVERCAGDVAGLDCLGESFIHNELAARAVDDTNALLHLRDGLLVDQAFGLRRKTYVEREEVGAGKDFVEREQSDVVFAGNDRRDERIVADDVHAESLGAASDFEANASEADDAKGLVAKLRTLQRFFVPLAGVHGGVRARDAAAHGDHEAEGEFGDGHRVGSRRVHDDDAAARGLGCIDVVDANAGAADDAEFGS